MSTTICLVASTLNYPQGGGHLWVYLNWALGLKANGCRIVWLERLGQRTAVEKAAAFVEQLQARLARYGLGDALAVLSASEAHRHLPRVVGDVTPVASADLLLNFQYDLPADVIARFRRSALLDIDPGLLQIWMSQGQIRPAAHDLYFTTGETIGEAGSPIPTCDMRWYHVPPCVSLEHWPVHRAADEAAFTTVSHWYADEWLTFNGETFANDKRSGFLPFLDLPRLTRQPLELALCLGADDDAERAALGERGWRVRNAQEVSATPWTYQQYVQSSRGEFSCVKPSCVKLQNAWISDRTLCYLASGKPAIVQHTGPSRFLPEQEGLLRFHDPAGAARALETAAEDYPRHCRLARELVERHFDARDVTARLLQIALN